MKGVLFSIIRRDNKAGRRLFSEKDIAQIKKDWEEYNKQKGKK